MVEVTPIDDLSYEKKTLKHFKKLLKDRKNADHKDKIYFRSLRMLRTCRCGVKRASIREIGFI